VRGKEGLEGRVAPARDWSLGAAACPFVTLSMLSDGASSTERDELVAGTGHQPLTASNPPHMRAHSTEFSYSTRGTSREGGCRADAAWRGEVCAEGRAPECPLQSMEMF
jgi:hypothetical protein